MCAPGRPADPLDRWRAEVQAARRLAENDIAKAIDEAARLEANAPAGAGQADRVRVLNVLARAEAYDDRSAQAWAHAQSALGLAVGLGDRIGEAEAELTLARVSVNKGNLGALADLSNRAVVALQGSDRPDLLAEAMLDAATTYGRLGKASEFVTTCLRALEIARQSGDPTALAYAHQGLGISFEQNNRPADAREHFQRMGVCARAAASMLLESHALRGEGSTTAELGDLRTAEALQRRALQLYRKLESPANLCFGLFGLADVLHKEGRISEALPLLDEVVAIYRRQSNPIALWFTLDTRSSYQSSLGRAAAAAADAESAYALARKIGHPLYIGESAHRLAGLAAAGGDFRRAYEYEQVDHDMAAKSAREGASSRVFEIVRDYENQNRERELERLRVRTEQQAAELRQRRLQQGWLWTVLGGSAMMIAGGAVFVLRLRLSRRNLAEQEARLRQRNRELLLVNRVIQATSSEQDFKAVLTGVCQELSNAFGVPRSSIVLMDVQTGKATAVAAHVPAGESSPVGISLEAVDTPLHALLAAERQPIAAEDAQQDARFSKLHDWYRKLGIRGQLVWPLIVEGQLAGAVFLSDTRRREFTADEVRLASSVSGTLSAALARSRLSETRRNLQEQVLRSQKMEAFGQLAGGIAHDFNNILTAILMHAALMHSDPRLPAELADAVNELEEDARRAANLTRQLLLFSRRQVMQRRTVDLNEVVAGMFKMLQRILGEHIKFTYNREGGLIPILADSGMIEQVVMNLCLNARDAMPRGGRLTIETGFAGSDKQPPAGKVHPARCACLSVTDNGCGMDADTQRRIFEPFFTTKAAGKGTGLGLATVHGIVEQHGGWVEVDSAPGSGSTFRVFLPALERLTEATAAPAAAPLASGSEAILLVEDEVVVRQVALTCLVRNGYRVVVASDGVEAVERWKQSGDGFELLITDMVMPGGMTGLELAERLKRERPSLRVLITSGYNAEMADLAARLGGGTAFLPKPFEISNLLQAVRRCLDAR